MSWSGKGTKMTYASREQADNDSWCFPVPLSKVNVTSLCGGSHIIPHRSNISLATSVKQDQVLNPENG
jgi:hypothetical protein